MNLPTLDRQIASEYLAIHVCPVTSNNIVIQEGQIASDQNDACPRHLAMLVTSC
jgi:hypothetical protein